MKELLEFIITQATGSSDFSISESETDEGITYQMQIPEEFTGRIIGKGGRNIKAIRDVLNIIARRENKRVFLKVNE